MESYVECEKADTSVCGTPCGTSDDRYETMVRPLPAGVKLTAIFDSCHSGTVLNLPYTVSPTERRADLESAIDVLRPSRTSNRSYKEPGKQLTSVLDQGRDQVPAHHRQRRLDGPRSRPKVHHGRQGRRHDEHVLRSQGRLQREEGGFIPPREQYDRGRCDRLVGVQG